MIGVKDKNTRGDFFSQPSHLDRQHNGKQKRNFKIQSIGAPPLLTTELQFRPTLENQHGPGLLKETPAPGYPVKEHLHSPMLRRDHQEGHVSVKQVVLHNFLCAPAMRVRLYVYTTAAQMFTDGENLIFDLSLLVLP